ncbi:GINS complex family protein [Babesia bovis T2Bo]|uniref:GINS subunit domain-containing protein n=1 Tax=Babesia bovis TaxID=5865 RepID=A7AM08_BABBO|nr:GINS complex family protein [Babesia bovis T2Bo]EDO07592.1 GINS complex family protein [Babesia bovis T2Bo]|eukprot:XP_001611160.1 hypothetical protein [Babesia bovis T2Bo]
MFDRDMSASASFDFLKKRKKNRQWATYEHDGDIDHTTASISTPLAESHPSNKKGSFRGILMDESRKLSQSQSQTQDTTLSDDYYVPVMPLIDYGSCRAFNYVIWARDQMVFGNEEILIQPDLEQDFLSRLEYLRSTVSSQPSEATSSSKIVEAIMEFMVDVEIGYRYLGSNANPFCRLSQIYVNGFIHLRPVNLAIFDFTEPTEELAVTIQRINVSGRVFAHHQLLSHFSQQCEFLPSKYCSGYIPKNVTIHHDYFPNLVTKVLLQRAKRQLVVVKAIVDVPGIDLSAYEGYVFDDLKTGEKAWLPIYMVERLSHFGFVSVDIPVYLTRNSLRELRDREEQGEVLEKLPNYYFFEIAHMFTRSNIFERVNVPNLSNRNHVYSYVSKLAGLIEDIKYQRLKKIRQTLEKIPQRESVISVDNLQYSETFYVNQFLSAYSEVRDINACSDVQSNAQIGNFVGDLENNLIDSLKVPLL